MIENIEKEVYMIIRSHAEVDIKHIVALVKQTQDETIIRKAIANLFNKRKIQRKDVSPVCYVAHLYYYIEGNGRERMARGMKDPAEKKTFVRTNRGNNEKTRKKTEPAKPKRLCKDGVFREYSEEDDARLKSSIDFIMNLGKK